MVFGACSGDGSGDRDKITLNVENPRWLTLNRNIKSFKRLQIISKVYPELQNNKQKKSVFRMLSEMREQSQIRPGSKWKTTTCLTSGIRYSAYSL